MIKGMNDTVHLKTMGYEKDNDDDGRWDDRALLIYGMQKGHS